MPVLTQEDQIIEALRSSGGYSTLRELYDKLTPNFSNWQTQTPKESVRCILQRSNKFYNIQKGLWALEEARESVSERLQLHPGDTRREEQFIHSYIQGLLVNIGNFYHKKTFVPAQDKNKLYLEQRLCELASFTSLPNFTYKSLLKRAKTIDVIWFNEREMPSHFYEVEHTTDIKNSLTKFYELQDFHSDFVIVAPAHRRNEFNEKIEASMFNPIKKRVKFKRYEDVVKMFEALRSASEIEW